ncbi:MAG: double-strand break repair protein AddB [Alphaproteobacteria bacterium]
MDGPAVFTIPPGTPFVDALAEGLIARAAGDPLALAQMTVLLPTRRAGRALREAFLRRGDGRPLLLPRMAPIGDVDADELTLAADDEGEADPSLDLPPALPDLRRRLTLARLVLAWGPADGNRPTPAQAAALAGELARLIDHLGTEGIDPARLADLGGDFARHWERTLDFLRILIDRWPAVLAASGALDPAVRRDRLIRAQAARWRAAPPADPVIAAGSTGSIPATAELLGVVARLPQGCIVLPGLDREADPALWPAIEADPTHPQHGMGRLLTGLGVAAHVVPPWPWPRDPGGTARSRLVAEALRPAGATEVWTRPEWRRGTGLSGANLDDALQGVRRIDCAGPHEEAGAIAILMRESLETPGRTAALVTPDRALARRVAAELKRWDVAVDDSAGTPLAETRPGALLRLVAEAFAAELAPVPLLALLKHPLAAFGMRPARFRRSVRAIEVRALRGVRPAPGLAALADALPSRHGALRALVGRLEAATRSFASKVAARETTLRDIIRAHVQAAETLAATDEMEGAAILWRGEDGEAAARFVAGVLEAADGFPPIAGADYAGLFTTLGAGIAVRPAWGLHPRLFIWGPLEARLQQADRVILGGLNEGTWPAIAEADPWLSRPMRAALGLPPVERRIGLSAHDFAQAIAAGEAFVTRAVKVDGTPTVPSRWLLRIDATLQALGRPGGLPRAAAPRDLQQRLDDRIRNGDRLVPRPARPIAPPAPRPPVALRPRRLSVTEVETWLADPYAIYARHVLRLTALDPLDAEVGAAERGIALHEALSRFIDAFPPPAPLPPDAFARLLAIARAALAAHLARPIVRAFWWPRFERIAAWFLAEEAVRRAAIAESWSERRGKWTFAAPAGPFTLTGRADRIVRIVGRGLEVIDYKTGTAPTARAVAEGRAPQLPLEAAMIGAGAFDGVPQEPPASLSYWRLTGADPPGEIRGVAEGAAATAALAADAQDGLAALVARFDDATTAYLAQPRPDWAPRFSDYAHLARIAEWAAGGEAEE